MLSILILSYNYDLYALVEKLQKECVNLGVAFEILCSDDNSQKHFRNKSIEQLSHCHYIIQPINIGRSHTRIFLMEQAVYDTVIMIDSDTYPVNQNFVARYLSALSNNEKAIVSGGLQYSNLKPKETELLRWVYGKSREAIPAKKRQLKPYKYTLCSNICFNKKYLAGIGFPAAVKGYGYEDFVFFKNLKENNREIIHIDNEVFHLKLETSRDFLDKTILGIHTFQFLLNEGIIDNDATSLSKNQFRLQRLGLQKTFNFFFKKTEAMITKNLTSSQPNLILFDLYKLGKLNQLLTKK